MGFFEKPARMPSPQGALPGRAERMPVAGEHVVLGTPIQPPWPPGSALALFGLGCFWGAERKFWEMSGVVSTQVGYAAGSTPNPVYEEICTGLTGHNEVVRVVFEPQTVSFDALLAVFFEAHDPTQGMRQGNDVGTQYRSGIYVYDAAQRSAAESASALYRDALRAAGRGDLTTEILDAPEFFYAEGYHQQYLARNPAGYCGLGGTGVAFPGGRLRG
ncbi:MAG: peptide-methionine (S)-S-oxide reductase MsrA [Deltaproteobacteria bacterium]|nr:peptide-methionine (S)-S-oxide reductase MsrA [Deltaproteobacteria bacterium]MBW2361093.1 peptide-methionine (S)-S-oxide reductase MsrA [Deltaproteobacteria bacterium]